MTQLFPDPCSPDPNPCPAQADDGIRWRLHAKRVDARGRLDVTGRTAGAGDLVVIRPTPTHSL